ncbi:hypothetical protein [Thermomonospora umbrina]|uniref:Uncharacterized protein n=1 Tax=Thermomonospora umbrina TaxID=111806 RepID=A0A3D9SQB6_9ACTN|nr:hypothetical protein [Thermomonospora umbrina]REE94774.1 hypothetical protein DFJ69_0132 [Thermomonospora umbrina]
MITVEHVERLLDARDPEAALVIVGGRAEVVRGGTDAGGLLVAERRDVLGRLGDERPSPEALEKVARALDTAVSEMGG